MTLTETFRGDEERPLASFDFFDIADGTGRETFYLVRTVDKNLMASNKSFSNTVATQSTVTFSGGTFTKTHDVDFDVLFNLPRRIRGQTIINIPFGISNTTVLKEYNSYIIVKVRHWDGTTETDLVENQSSTLQIPGSEGSTIYKIASGAIDIDIPLTHFKKGETLRLTVEQWTQVTFDPSTGVFFFGHSPNDRNTSDEDDPVTFGTSNSRAEFLVPFVLDL